MTSRANTKIFPEAIEAPLLYYIDDGTPAENFTGDETDSTRIYQGNYEHRKVRIQNARKKISSQRIRKQSSWRAEWR